MTEKTWWLRDIGESKTNYPYTFYKPSDAILEKIEPGSCVKLIFEFSPPSSDGCSAERMWVRVTQREKESYQGTLENQPKFISDLNQNDLISFESKNIADTEYFDPADKELDKYSPLCLVTQSVLDGDQIGLIQRGDPNNEKDSGWVFSGDYDSQEYLDDSNNLKIRSLGAVLNIDDSFIHLLDSPIDACFEWDRKNRKFIPYEIDKEWKD